MNKSNVCVDRPGPRDPSTVPLSGLLDVFLAAGARFYLFPSKRAFLPESDISSYRKSERREKKKEKEKGRPMPFFN